MKKVYTCFCTDVIHEGHLNILRKAEEYGEVVVGVLCDPEMVRYNRFPSKSQEERIAMVEA
ncbi:MAG: adenylyltransferase/cytidyltransferase family protein, partial [Selenomonadaceae bacterium]|nr:adenylyltransferase/cytidyltransferase family protein [Selenomonadaceae bacterium]